MPKRTAKRLSPEARSSEILNAAKRLLDRAGVQNFSLEAVAREAGVAASLPRHYFGSSVELLAAATIDAIKEVERALRSPNPGIPLPERLSAYLDVIQRHPWAHSIWIRSAEIHPTIHEIVQKSRIRLGEAIFYRQWSALTKQEQIHARGCVGFFEAVVAEWIDRDFSDRELVLEALVHWVKNLQPMISPDRGETVT